LAQRPGQRARPDRHHRLHDGLRHHRVSSRTSGAGEVQEARRRRLHADRQQRRAACALRSLGYQEEQVEAIVDYIAEHGHVVDAPGLRPEHYEVFDCAVGERSIAPMGHVRMMAAVQPFLSGAISKTVNMPESATVEDVEEIYFQGWKLGLKALAIYRDNCKVGQPLSSAKKDDQEGPGSPTRRSVEYRPVRKRLPKKRPSQTISFTVGGAEGYLTPVPIPDDGLGEIFVKLGKQGSTLAGVMDAFSMSISVGLQYGIPLEFYVSEVPEPALRAGGDDRRPGHPDGDERAGLPVPQAGAGLPAVREARPARHLHRRGAGRSGER
jgi:hypothetical protein